MAVIMIAIYSYWTHSVINHHLTDRFGLWGTGGGGVPGGGQEKVTDTALKVSLNRPILVQCGKRKFARIEYAG